METRFLSFENTRLALHVAGKGPVALLVHGYPLDHRMWLDVLHGPLAEQRTLVAVDLRGHGASPWCGDAVHTMDLFAADLAAIAHTIADEPIDLVGLSMGGYVALAALAEHPQLWRSLVLVDTKAKADDEVSRSGRDTAIRTVVEHGRGALVAGMAERLLAKRAAGDTHGLLLRARLRSLIEEQPVETIVADLRGLRDRPDRSELLPRLALSTLVVVGEHDALTPPTEARAMAAAIPGARCAVIPGAGHLVPMEAPAAFAAELGAFWGAGS